MAHSLETIKLTKEFRQIKSLQEAVLHPFKKSRTIRVLDDVNISVKQGELFCLVGPNGAGKTTLLKILSALILPTSGTASVNGYDIIKDEEKVRASIGLVTGEERSFYWRLTGRQNLQFFAVLHNFSYKKAEERIEELADLLEIREYLDRRYQTYSTGTKQRLGIARSLLSDAAVLFMDEPTRSLDPIAAQHLRTLIRDRLARTHNRTVVYTSHQLPEAQAFSDRLAIMHKGRIKACGTFEELREVMGNREASVEQVFSHFVENRQDNETFTESGFGDS